MSDEKIRSNWISPILVSLSFVILYVEFEFFAPLIPYPLEIIPGTIIIVGAITLFLKGLNKLNRFRFAVIVFLVGFPELTYYLAFRLDDYSKKTAYAMYQIIIQITIPFLLFYIEDIRRNPNKKRIVDRLIFIERD